MRRVDDCRGVDRRGQRDHQLPARRRRAGLRHQRLRPAIEKLRDRLTNVEHIIEVTPGGGDGDEYEALLAGATPTQRGADVEPGDVCMVMYSSGTTGRPKGLSAVAV